jgi:hypothetical protein
MALERPRRQTACGKFPLKLLRSLVLSGYFYRTVVITMTIMGVMEMASDQIIDMISMGHGLMTTSGPVHMPLLVYCTFVPRCTVFGVRFRYGYDMFINMAAVRVVQMPVVQIVDVIVMNDSRVTAFRAMRMSMIFVLWQVTISHCRFLMKVDEITHCAAYALRIIT